MKTVLCQICGKRVRVKPFLGTIHLCDKPTAKPI